MLGFMVTLKYLVTISYRHGTANLKPDSPMLSGARTSVISDLTVVSVENGPHNTGWTHPEETNAAPLDFLNQ